MKLVGQWPLYNYVHLEFKLSVCIALRKMSNKRNIATTCWLFVWVAYS